MKVFILAGGSGTRLWPLSRERYPKQFIKLMNDKKSLFQRTFERSLKLTDIHNIYIITNKDYKYLVMGEIEEIGYEYIGENILLEPEGKNTLPAICYGLYKVGFELDYNAVIFSSDHFIERDDEFINNINESLDLSRDHIVTFGIKPSSPNTGYGYISIGVPVQNGYKVEEFKEKPDKDTALDYIEKNYLWNSGIFMFNSKVFLREVEKYSLSIVESFKKYDLIEDVFSNIEGISVDYGVLEKSSKVAVVPVDIGWNDLGSFDSFYEVFARDKNNNISKNGDIFLESNDSLVYSDDGKTIALVGMKDVIVVDNKDALLICKKEKSQKVKEVVDILKNKGDNRIKYGTSDYRPWGHYEILDESKNSYKIKKIIVNEGKRISYQMHYHRSEHWVVVKGTAKVTIDGKINYVNPGESIFVKKGQKHRLENPGKLPLEIVEVQMGDYVQEDDIIRFDDDFERNK